MWLWLLGPFADGTGSVVGAPEPPPQQWTGVRTLANVRTLAGPHELAGRKDL